MLDSTFSENVTPAPADGDDRPAGPGDDTPDWPPWTAPAALVMALAVGTIAALLVVLIVAAALHITIPSNGNFPGGLNVLATVVQDACFVLVAIWFARIGGRRITPGQFGLRATRVLRAAWMVAFVYVTFLVFTDIWSEIVNTPQETLLKSLGANNSTALLVASAILTCVVAPCAEEFLFRGVIFTALRNWRGPWVSAALTGLAFGAVHAESAPIADLVPLALFGFGLCWLRWRTDSLLPGIAAHSINNSIAFAALEGWAAGDYVLLLLAALAALAVIGTGMRATGLIVARPRPAALAG